MTEKIIYQQGNVTIGYRYATATTGVYFIRIDTGDPFGVSETDIPGPPPQN